MKDITKKFNTSSTTFADAPEEDQDFLHTFSFICMLSFDVFVKCMLIEKLIDETKEMEKKPKMSSVLQKRKLPKRKKLPRKRLPRKRLPKKVERIKSHMPGKKNVPWHILAERFLLYRKVISCKSKKHQFLNRCFSLSFT